MKHKILSLVFLVLFGLNFLPDTHCYSQDFVDLAIIQTFFEDPCDQDQQIGLEIMNNGTLEASNIPVSLMLNENLMFDEIIPGPIQPGTSLIYYFSGTVDVSISHYSENFNFRFEIDFPDDLNISDNIYEENRKFYNPNYVDKEGWTTYNLCNSTVSHNVVTAVIEDTHEIIWAGMSSDGIAKYENNSWTLISVESGDILSNNIECMMLDGLGNIWIGYWEGEGASMYDGNNWTHYNNDNSGIVSGGVI